LTASEFAFLAIGLVLGVASGAALIEVLRSRPPGARHVRVTVAPNAIHARLASTLADPGGVGEPVGPAPGGPGDRRWHDDEIFGTDEPVATDRRAADPETGRPPSESPGESGTSVRSMPDDAEPSSLPTAGGLASPTPPPVPSPVPAEATLARAEAERPAPLWLRPASTGPRAGLVAVPMSMEPDPITASLRSTAAASAVAAMARRAPTATGSRLAATSDAGSASVATANPSARGKPAGAAGGSAMTESPPAADGPCAEERRVAEERCSVATRAREGSTAAAESLRRAQRSYDELLARAETAASTADPRSVRTAKEQAQQRFREARNKARTRDDVEAGARAWLAEINRINQETREASQGIDRDRAAAAALGPMVERLSVEADAARISAERADEACVAAREAVAACDEARTLEAAAARTGAAVAETATEPGEAAEVGSAAAASRIAAATPEPEDEFAFSTPMHSQAGQDALIQRILRGDRDAMQRAVARLAGDDPEARRLWQAQLGNLVEALIARSIEASAFDFPIDHPFWGPFSQSQNRDIAAGLSSLGFRFDGFGDWVDERLPSQRDLAMAVGYAGLDPMRVRRWPTEAETRDLLRDIRVAADEYIAGAAGGLTLGELVTLLGRRADGLAELWNQWGSVRPILLEAT
jgi:hypothetical protein